MSRKNSDARAYGKAAKGEKMYADQGAVEDWHDEALAGRVVEALQGNGFEAAYFPAKEEARTHILECVAPHELVAIGGSVSLHQLDLIKRLRSRGTRLITIYETDLEADEMVARMRQQMTSDVFLSSVNALTMDGCLVNVDSTGNRTAAMTFGPKRVVVVAGVNKICVNVEAAFERIRMTAAPRNNKRIDLYKHRIELRNPCLRTGVCMDCRSETRICRVYSVLKRRPMFTPFEVVLVGEPLGF